MLQFVARRLLVMIPTLLAISVISFTMIQLPPGDFVSRTIENLIAEAGDALDEGTMEQIELLRVSYGLDRPIIVQYFRWFFKALRGDLGYSFQWNRPVSEIIWTRIGLTLVVTISALFFSWAVAFPIGFYAAVRQHTIGDYVVTFVGFIGLAIPNFLLALVMLYVGFLWFGQSFSGLFSQQFIDAPFSLAKLVDLLKHLWIPVIVVGTSGTAGLIRVLRNNLLDELQKGYVVTARAKGLDEAKLLFKYPVRVAINPFLSTVGWLLPTLISGSVITEVVLNLPTAGTVLLQALFFQDMYLAGAIVMIMAMLTVIGTLVSDILLAAVDPRIRYD